MTHARAFATKERQQQVIRLSRLGRSLLLLLATVLSFSAIGLFIADQLYRPDAFVVDQLKIKGRFKNLRPYEIESVVQAQVSGNFFSINLSEIKQSVLAQPWVQTAEVRREWPNTLLIQATEQRPIMRWDDDRWVNSQGEVIELPGKVTLNNALVLSGNEDDAYQMMHQALRWQQRLLSKGLEMTKLTLSDSHAYVLHLENDAKQAEFDVYLGRDDIERRFTRFLQLFEQRFVRSDQRLLHVDARYPNGLAVKSEPLPENLLSPPLEELALNQPNSDS